MANIKRIEGKTGVSYKITVAKGRDSNGKQIRHYTTWTPPQGMGEKRAEKEVQKIALQYETQIEQGFQLDNRQTFLEYARYVISLKEQGGAKHNTILEYRHLLSRLEPTLGRMKLTEIRPQHLSRLYKDLQAPNVRTGEVKARGKGNLAGKLKKLGMSRAALSKAAGVAPVTVTHACRGEAINGKKAEAIAAVLDADVKDYFELRKESQALSGKTVLEYHRFVHTVLAQAEREMLVPYNAAAKITPPAVTRKEPEYFQPEQIADILTALEDEPEKWRVLTHLLIVTGCRRGEVAGLKWSKVDLENGRLEISANLCYSKERGIYETTTKTGNVRFVNIPAETVALLKKYRASQAALRLANGDRWQDTGYLFTQDDGRPMNPTSITAWLNKFSKRRGLPHIHPHSFRHSVASILISAGTDLVTVAGQLGHTQTSTTADIYAHVVEKTKAQATECIADIMLRGKRA
jgi:integrase